MTKKILIGKITAVFGIKGQVKIISYCDIPQNIENYPLFDEAGNKIKLEISNKNKTIIGSTFSGDSILIAKIEGINDRTAAQTLRGKEIFTNRQDFNQLKDDEFYHVDLIGLDVINLNSEKIGKVVNIYDYKAGAMLEIKFNKSDIKNNREKVENFAFKNEIFPEVNLKKGFIKIDMPEIIKGDE